MSGPCSFCAGDGWNQDHSDECYAADLTDCSDCPVQRWCDACQGTGQS